MADIWVKILKQQKIKKDFIYNTDYKTSKDFEYILREICSILDIPTPLILEKHTHNFENFNQARFKKHEFVESIDFDELVLENIPDENLKKSKNNELFY